MLPLSIGSNWHTIQLTEIPANTKSIFNIFRCGCFRNDNTGMALWVTNYSTWKDWVLKYLGHNKKDYVKKSFIRWFPNRYFESFRSNRKPNLMIENPIERIPNRRDEDYFYVYKNTELKQISWCQQLLNFISRCLYIMTGPKFIVPILGIVQKRKSSFSNSR